MLSLCAAMTFLAAMHSACLFVDVWYACAWSEHSIQITEGNTWRMQKCFRSCQGSCRAKSLTKVIFTFRSGCHSSVCPGRHLQISSDQPWNYRSNGVQRSSTTKTAVTKQIQMSINTAPDQASDWAVAAVLIYDTDLTTSQMMSIEDYLSVTCGIGLGRTIQPSPPPSECVIA